jgi:hypothetical protein
MNGEEKRGIRRKWDGIAGGAIFVFRKKRKRNE